MPGSGLASPSSSRCAPVAACDGHASGASSARAGDLCTGESPGISLQRQRTSLLAHARCGIHVHCGKSFASQWRGRNSTCPTCGCIVSSKCGRKSDTFPHQQSRRRTPSDAYTYQCIASGCRSQDSLTFASTRCEEESLTELVADSNPASSSSHEGASLMDGADAGPCGNTVRGPERHAQRAGTNGGPGGRRGQCKAFAAATGRDRISPAS